MKGGRIMCRIPIKVFSIDSITKHERRFVDDIHVADDDDPEEETYVVIYVSLHCGCRNFCSVFSSSTTLLVLEMLGFLSCAKDITCWVLSLDGTLLDALACHYQAWHCFMELSIKTLMSICILIRSRANMIMLLLVLVCSVVAVLIIYFEHSTSTIIQQDD